MNLLEALINLRRWCPTCNSHVHPCMVKIIRYGKLVPALVCSKCGYILEVDE